MSKKYKILISNDDGISSKGIYALKNALKDLGEVFVYAPNRQQSAVGHAITVSTPLRVEPYYVAGKLFGYAIDGTPADCVKLAVKALLPEQPDLVVSGINHGSNTAVNIIYSGTVSAAAEGLILGIPSIAFSLTTRQDFDFTFAERVAHHITQLTLENGLPQGVLLNVNIPAVTEDQIKGIIVTKQGKSRWDDQIEKRIDPNKKEYYWLAGRMEKLDDDIDVDEIATRNNYISVTPIQYDLTAYKFLDELKSWNFNGKNF